jgi:hypothetical protein
VNIHKLSLISTEEKTFSNVERGGGRLNDQICPKHRNTSASESLLRGGNEENKQKEENIDFQLENEFRLNLDYRSN